VSTNKARAVVVPVSGCTQRKSGIPARLHPSPSRIWGQQDADQGHRNHSRL